MTTPASLLNPEAFLSPLAIDEAVQRALDEDLGRAGDITSIATIPEATKAHAILIARQSGVIAGLPLAVATFQKLSPDINIQAHFRDGATVASGVHVLTISGPARAVLAGERTALNFVGRLSGIATLTSRLCAPYRRHQITDLLHPQDHAGPARAGEIRGALRRRLQSPLRARRCDPDQGQPHRGRRRRAAGAGARAGPRRTPRQGSRSKSIRWRNCARCSTPGSPTWCCWTIWISATLTEAVKLANGRVVLEASGGVTLGLDCEDRRDRRRLCLGGRADALRAEFRRRAGY